MAFVVCMRLPSLCMQTCHKATSTRSILERFCVNNWEKGLKDFVKICHVKKTCVGEGGECEHTLDDTFGI